MGRVAKGRWMIVGAVALALVVAVGALWKWRGRDAVAPRAPASAASAPATLVFLPSETAQPRRVAMPETIEFQGALAAPRTATVRAKAPGTLLALRVAEGSRVRAGESLGAIDLSDLQARAAERSAVVDSARARVAEAERLHRSNVDLADQKFISPNALETSRASLEAARAQLRSAQAQQATSTLGIREAALVAPIDGIVGRRSVVPGEKVSAEQELLTIVDLTQLELSGIVGTHQVTRLAPGQPVAVRVEGAAAPIDGRIDRIAPTVETGTRGIRVVVAVPNRGERFRAGQYASASVRIDDPQARLTVPIEALGQESGQEFVWTVERGVLVRRIVVTGRRDEGAGRAEVTQGLADDATLLAVRFDGLKEGAPARIGEAAAGAPGARRPSPAASGSGSASVSSVPVAASAT